MNKPLDKTPDPFWGNVEKTHKAIKAADDAGLDKAIADMNLRQTLSMVLAGHRNDIYHLCPASYSLLSRALKGGDV